jgi:hypothetical protein
MGDDGHIDFVQKFPDEKESVRWCVVVMEQPVNLSLKFGAKSSHIFAISPYNVAAVCGIYYLVC